jgi:flagellar hook-basal body complex protein FliE
MFNYNKGERVMINGFNKGFMIQGRITNPYFNTSFMKNKTSIDEDNKKASFSDVLSNMSTSFNNDLSAPDKLLADAVNGNGDVDVHDVTTSLAKAEMAVSLATQITSKVIAAYEKVSQIAV